MRWGAFLSSGDRQLRCLNYALDSHVDFKSVSSISNQRVLVGTSRLSCMIKYPVLHVKKYSESMSSRNGKQV